MTQLQTMSDQEINRKLAELMGYKVREKQPGENGIVFYELIRPSGKVDLASVSEEEAFLYVPDYAGDPAASLEVQTAAIAKDAEGYVRNIAIIKWGDAVDPEEVADWTSIGILSVSELLTATPRQIAEAAYITLQAYQVDKQ